MKGWSMIHPPEPQVYQCSSMAVVQGQILLSSSAMWRQLMLPLTADTHGQDTAMLHP